MKFRLTPLNIVAALALAFFVVSFFQSEPVSRHVNVSGLFRIIFGAIVVVAFVTDMIFRFIFKDLKRIWLVEMVFIALTVILFLLLQK